MLTGIQQLVLEVADLEHARQIYFDLGFELAVEGDAVVACNPDDSLVIVQADHAVEGLRWIDIASDNLAGDVAAIRGRGFNLTDPAPLANGLVAAAPGTGNPLPLRIVQPAAGGADRRPGNHPNGVQRLDRVYLVYSAASGPTELMARLLGKALPPLQRGWVIKADMAVFDLGQNGIGVAAPVETGPAADALEQRGAGPFQVLFRTRSMSVAGDWIVGHGLPTPARAVRNNGEAAMLVHRKDACGMYLALVGPE